MAGRWFARLLLVAKKPQSIEQAQIIATVWPINDEEALHLSELWSDAINKTNLPLKHIRTGSIWGAAIAGTLDVIDTKAKAEIAFMERMQQTGQQQTGFEGLQKLPIPADQMPPREAMG